jgi:hypothetical protein
MSKKDMSIVQKFEAELQAIDDIVVNNDLAESNTQGGFTAAFRRAQSMKELTEMITPEMMKPVMFLMNTKLGFLTDKDPAKGASQTYSEDVVKRVIMEATLRGFPLIGNCLNIIAGNFYATKEGLEYRLRETKNLKFETVMGIPQVNGQRATVEATVKGTHNGEVFKITRLYPIRVNKGMGDDGLIGKAKRRIYGELYNHITVSTTTFDGDVEDTGSARDVAPKQADATVITDANANAVLDAVQEARGGIIEAEAIVTPQPQQDTTDTLDVDYMAREFGKYGEK